MSLQNYLPSAEEVNRCIKNEAEGAHEAVLLSVHQPSPLSYKSSYDLTIGNTSVQTNEQELFDYLVSPHVATGALVVPITGASGVGKSHLIRILDARLRSSPETKKHLIIRIPKSASLRRVVELILEPLPESTYSKVKKAFKTALASVDVETSAIRFQSELEIALKSHALELKTEAEQSPTPSLRLQLDHAQRLPLLLNDLVTGTHFRQTILPRIIQRAIAGVDDREVDVSEGQFCAADLKLPDSIDLGQAAKPVNIYYTTALQSRGGQGREVAASVLNSVVNQATKQLFNLNESIEGMTLEEVILEIRRLLLKEKKDLFLLVEDFAALTGIQDTLAKVLIQEGIRDGVTQFATMRSVIAVTDGYLVGKNTLATRAMREWIVESKIHSEEEVLSRSRSLVASYLNAARWGEEELAHRYSSKSLKDIDASDWLPVYTSSTDEEVGRIVSAFGVESEIPLFPFNDSAIEYLTRSALTGPNGLVFNPRFIINEVLRKVLLSARSSFEKGRFPPTGIESHSPSAEVAQWLATLGVSEEVKERYKRTVIVWGNNPRNRSEIASIRKEVFEAFGLNPPTILSDGPSKSDPKKLNSKKPDSAPPPPPLLAVKDPEVEKVRSALENWVQGTLLPQNLANEIRKELANVLNEQIDWNAERCLKIEIDPNQISIPLSGGQGRITGKSIEIGPDHTDKDGRLRAEILALIRCRSIRKSQTDYLEYEEDYGRIGNLIDRLMPQALREVRSRNIEQCQMAILALSINSGALGLSSRGQTAKTLNYYLFGKAEEPELLPPDAPQIFKDWKLFQADIWKVRPRLTTLLTATAGCFQGVGVTPLGIDIVRITENYPDDKVKLEISKLDRLSPEEKQILPAMTEQRVVQRLRLVENQYVKIRKEITKILGEKFDKNSIVEVSRSLAEEMGRGVWNNDAIGATSPEYLRLCEEFRAVAVMEAINPEIADAASPQIEGENSAKIFKVATINLPPLLVAERFARLTNAVLERAKSHALMLEAQFAGVNAAKKSEEILNLLTTIDSQVGKLIEKE